MRYYLAGSRSGRKYIVIRWLWEMRVPIPRRLYHWLQRRKG